MVWVPPDGGAGHGPFRRAAWAAGGAKSSLRVAKALDRRDPIGLGMLVITMEGFLARPSDEPSFSSSDP